jgi:MFS family permease
MNRSLLFVALSLFTWGLGEGSFLPFQTLYLENLGASPLDIGAILGAFGVANALAHIPAGYLADRLGRKPLMTAAWILGVLATGMMGLASSLPLFIAGMLTYGLTLFVLAPLNSYVTAARGSWSIGRAITLVSASFHLGAMAGPWLGGWLGENYGYRSIFQVAAGIFMLSTLFILFIRPQPVENDPVQEKGFALFRNRVFMGFIALLFLVNFCLYLPQPLSPNYLQSVQGLSLSQIGRLYFLSSLGVVTLNLILGQFPARLGFLIAQAGVGLFSLLLWRGEAAWLPLAFFALGGYRTARSLATAQARTLVRGTRMGLAYGMVETFSSFAVILAPLLAGFLYDRNPDWVYAAALALSGLSIAASAAFFARQRARQVRTAATALEPAGDALTPAEPG